MGLVSVIDFFGTGTWYHESYAQKVCRLLRYAFTGTRICVRAVAQRGVGRPPSDSERSEEGEESSLEIIVSVEEQNFTIFLK